MVVDVSLTQTHAAWRAQHATAVAANAPFFAAHFKKYALVNRLTHISPTIATVEVYSHNYNGRRDQRRRKNLTAIIPRRRCSTPAIRVVQPYHIVIHLARAIGLPADHTLTARGPWITAPHKAAKDRPGSACQTNKKVRQAPPNAII